MNHYSTIKTSIGRVSIEPTMEHSTSYRGFLSLLDYISKIQLIHHLDEHFFIKNKVEHITYFKFY